jgi:hypothetical protein
VQHLTSHLLVAQAVHSDAQVVPSGPAPHQNQFDFDQVHEQMIHTILKKPNAPMIPNLEFQKSANWDQILASQISIALHHMKWKK